MDLNDRVQEIRNLVHLIPEDELLEDLGHRPVEIDVDDLAEIAHDPVRRSRDEIRNDLLEVVDISQPTISHHLKKLVEAGLLVREQRGKWAHYSVVRESFNDLRSFLDLS